MDITIRKVNDNPNITIKGIANPLIENVDGYSHVYIGISATSLNKVHLIFTGGTSPDYEKDVSAGLEKLIKQENMYALHLTLENYLYEYQEPEFRTFTFKMSAYTNGDASGVTSFEIVQNGCADTCLVTWVSNGEKLQIGNILIGDTPYYKGEEPKKESEQKWYECTFVGWSPTPGPVSADTVYNALFIETLLCNVILYTCGKEIPGDRGAYGTGVKWIEYQYDDNTGIGVIICNNCITEIDPEAGFGRQGYLTEVILPNSLDIIHAETFLYCVSLSSVTIGNGVTNIEELAFYGCNSLTSITIPSSVANIGKNAFYGCDSLTSVSIDSDDIVNHQYDSSYNLSNIFGSQVIEYIIGNNVTGVGDYALYGCVSLSSVTIGNSVTTIGMSAFEGCSYLQHIGIPSSVANIGQNAFYGCDSLAYVSIDSDAIVNHQYDSSYNLSNIFGSQVIEYVIGNNVTKIGDCAFLKCSNLIFVTIGNSVTTIGMSAFEGCSYLQHIGIPSSVANIGKNAFYGCDSLTSVSIDSDDIVNHQYDSSYNLSNIFGSQVIEYIIGNSVRHIGKCAFYNCTPLTHVTIGNRVETIEDEAFYGCNSLTSVTINSNAIVDNGYDPYYNLSKIFGKQVNEYIIGGRAMVIGDNAFFNCVYLTSVTIGNGVKIIGGSAFSKCHSLTSVTIGNSVREIGYEAFCGCDSLTDITIPNSVTDINGRSFANCASLTSVTIGNSVTSIGDEAFTECGKLTSVTCKNTNPPTVFENTFNVNTLTNGVLHVPSGCKGVYADNGWKFGYIIEDVV